MKNDDNNKNFTSELLKSYTFKGQSIGIGLGLCDDGLDMNIENIVQLPLSTMNRHGLIAGATGTGKTKTLQKIIEQLSLSGVPSLVMDIKGDISGISQAGISIPGSKLEARIKSLKVTNWQPQNLPTEFMTISNGQGVKIRATISEFGPVFLSKILDLNDIQSSVISLVFKYCDEKGLLLLDLKDLKKSIQYLSTEGKSEIEMEYGAIAPASMSAIMRSIITLEEQGGDALFGEKSFEVGDLTRTDGEGNGFVSILRVADMQSKPKIFSTFMLCMMAEIFENFEEAGDLEKPKLCIFIDEAHLLFDNSNPTLIEKIEIMVKLIRSKGVGIYFITQNPMDIPSSVLSQLGLKVQHALRAFTANDNKAIKLASDNFPISKYYDIPTVLTSMEIGEALVTCLGEDGNPTMLIRTKIFPPETRMDVVTSQEIDNNVARSQIASKYYNLIDGESAYEILGGKIQQAVQKDTQNLEAIRIAKEFEEKEKLRVTAEKEQTKVEAQKAKEAEKIDAGQGGIFGDGSIGKSILRSLSVTMTGAIARQVLRGMFGNAKKK